MAYVNMAIVINCAMKEARRFLHRTQDPAKPHKHRATVCIICDRFIIGTETTESGIPHRVY